jgi:phosphoenolpyruvate carboxykinase (GTP)
MHATITEFVGKWTDILKPNHVVWIKGNDGEPEELLQVLRARNENSVVAVSARENCYAFFSSPTDVARMESQTFISSKEDPGPLNNAWEHDDCLKTMTGLFSGVMQGRTMYIIPFCLGPVGGKHSKYGIQITDSEYACINMSIMCRVGQQALDAMTLNGGAFVPCIHSVGACDFANMAWPNSNKKHICHFINDHPFIMSYGSGYGGNALLSKKCFALRVASVMGRKEGWLAEHCLLLKMTSPPPASETKYVVAAFPSACGKTNLAMITPCKELMDEGWTFETLGDDIVWMHVIDGKLYAQNVENGFFGVAPGTNATTNGHAIASLSKDCIFTNCATYQNERGETDVWWEGLTPTPPASFTNWKGETNPTVGVAAHPNARYTCPIKNCPILAKEYEDLVPIHAIIFGGRRETTIPLVTKATSVERGIFFGATLSSEETSANMDAKVGNVRFDPMAMRPFIGYNVCDYFQHWADVMARLTTPVEFYLVNWFRKDAATNKFVWKGFSENSKVLKWIFTNSTNGLRNRTTALGEHPQGEDIYMHDEAEWQKLFEIKPDQLSKFAADVQLHFDTLEINNESKVPPFLRDELNKLSNSSFPTT